MKKSASARIVLALPNSLFERLISKPSSNSSKQRKALSKDDEISLTISTRLVVLDWRPGAPPKNPPLLFMSCPVVSKRLPVEAELYLWYD